MANLMQFLNKTQTIDTKCEILADQLLQDYQNGIIKTELELYYRLKQVLLDFYSSIGKPTYKFKPARGTPISSDFNGMIASSCEDMRIVIDECNNISEAIKSSFVDSELTRQMMFNKMQFFHKRLDDIEGRIVTNNNTNLTVYTDFFTNKDYCELLVDDSAAFINTTDGVLTLGTKSSDILSIGSRVEILEGSNGFPGTTHEVDILNRDLHFIGESTLHMDLNDVIDNNSDTWFEYEVFNMNDDVVERCNGYGFNYKEGLSWVTEDTSLRLRLKITIKEPTQCNWLSLTPFIPESCSSKTSYITKCILSDDHGGIQEVKQVKIFDDNTVILFNAQVVSSVIIEIEQNIPYSVNVGHFYFTKTDPTSTLIFDEAYNSNHARIDGPVPSVQLLNMRYDPATKKCINPKNYNDDLQDTVIDESFIKQQLFTQPSDGARMKAGKEILRAHRYCIGIKNISVSRYTFHPESVYLSTLFGGNDFIKSISLEADELIPVEFNEGLKPEDRNKWIKYEISMDNGNKWERIYPRHRSFQGPCTFKINSDTPKTLRNANIKYIDKLIEPTAIRLKITLSRPEGEGMDLKTPVVFAYKLKIQTGDEETEY